MRYEDRNRRFNSRSERRYEKEKKHKNNLNGWLLCIIIAVVAALCVRAFIVEPIQVEGNSMNPSLFSHQTMLVEKVSKLFELPGRGSVVIVHYPNSSNNYVKRVIALPGESVWIKDSTVYVDGNALEEDYTSDDSYPDMNPVTVPENSLFVMGDNRANSQDSRYVGPIPKEDLVGKAVCVIWPLDQWQNI